MRLIKNLKRRISDGRRLSRVLSDEAFIRWRHELRVGYTPDLETPSTFNEKLHWLKLHGVDARQPQLVDKLAVRAYVEQRCGKGILNELLRVYERVEDIDPATLPRAFVLRPTHSSGANVICPDKAALDWPRARARLRRDLARSYYWKAREPVYRDLPRRIVCERFLGGPGTSLPDYKFFCFGGQPRLVQVDIDRFGKHARAMLDLSWNPLDFSLEYPLPERAVEKPSLLDEMCAHAARLAEPFPFVRVDLYQVDQRVVFGELTFYPGGGFERFDPQDADRRLGQMLELPGSTAVLAARHAEGGSR